VAAFVLALQARAGNRAVARALTRGPLAVARNGKDGDGDEDDDRPSGGRPRRRTAKYAKRYEPYSRRLREREGLRGRRAAESSLPATRQLRQVFWFGARDQLHFTDYPGLLGRLGAPVPDPNDPSRLLYTCAHCGAQVPRESAARGNERTIDLQHVRDWLTFVTMRIDKESRVVEGHRYFGYPLEDAREAYQDEENLEAWCSHCNRSAGGPKHYDRSDPPEHDPSTCPACRPSKPPPGPRRDDGDDEEGAGGLGGGEPIAV
jgi:hypothetical protein